MTKRRSARWGDRNAQIHPPRARWSRLLRFVALSSELPARHGLRVRGCRAQNLGLVSFVWCWADGVGEGQCRKERGRAREGSVRQRLGDSTEEQVLQALRVPSMHDRRQSNRRRAQSTTQLQLPPILRLCSLSCVVVHVHAVVAEQLWVGSDLLQSCVCPTANVMRRTSKWVCCPHLIVLSPGGRV